MLTRLDDFFVDRVFQPLVDRLAGRITRGVLASNLLLGSAVVDICRSYIEFTGGRFSNGDAVWAGLGLALYLWFAWQARQSDGKTRLGFMPEERLSQQWLRKFFLVLLLFSCALIFCEVLLRTFAAFDLVGYGSTALKFCGFCIWACRQNPPRPRRQSVEVDAMQPVPTA